MISQRVLRRLCSSYKLNPDDATYDDISTMQTQRLLAYLEFLIKLAIFVSFLLFFCIGSFFAFTFRAHAATINIPVTTGDGGMGTFYDPDWTTTRNSATGNYAFTAGDPDSNMYHYYTGGNYILSRAFFPFDLTTLAGDTINSVTFHFYSSPNTGTFQVGIVEWTGAATSWGSTVFGNVGTTEFSDTRDTLGSSSGFFDMTLNAAGIAYFQSKAGSVGKIALRSDDDLDNTPFSSGPYTAFVSFTQTAQVASIDIDYTEPGPPPPPPPPPSPGSGNLLHGYNIPFGNAECMGYHDVGSGSGASQVCSQWQAWVNSDIINGQMNILRLFLHRLMLNVIGVGALGSVVFLTLRYSVKIMWPTDRVFGFVRRKIR